MEQWLAPTITVSIFCGFLLILVLSLQAFNLCEDQNRWGIVLFSFILPIIGTVFSVIYFAKKFHRFSKPRKKKVKKNNKKN